jgi:DeoR family glycerol-3-phosphate regulon repressor
VEEVKSGETLFLDAGSTNNIFIDYLMDFNELTILTPDLMSALKLLQQTSFKVIVVGGEVSRATKSVKDYTAVEMLKRYNVDSAFIGCDSFSPETGACTTSSEKAVIKRAAMSIANKVVLLSASDKFYKRSLLQFADLEDFHKLYLSEPFEDVDRLEELNIDIILC